MHNTTTIPIIRLMEVADRELIRLNFKASALYRHSKEFRNFLKYCEENSIENYCAETGSQYFKHLYGLNIGDPTVKLTKPQLDTRCSIRFLDDIFQFGYALRYSHHDYTVPLKYIAFLEDYLTWCRKHNSSEGTIRVKRTKLRQFFSFLDGRKISFTNLTPADISDFMTTLCRYHRATVHVFSSVLRDFFRYCYENEIVKKDLSVSVPRPKIYTEENIPETWTNDEVRQVLAVIDRNNGIGKRDYAMLLMAILLGMRAGDICALKFKNLDWNQKLIIYTQQKTKKVNTLPLLPIIGEAIIDYLKNGRLDSNCDNVFVRHIHPYGEFQSSTAISENLKRYMRQAGLTVKKRKSTHSLRHTLASELLQEGIPLMTISNILGHCTPKTTSVYTKVDIPALRKCALSYGKRRASV